MSEYLDEVKQIIRPEIGKWGLKILPKGRSSFSLLRKTDVVMTVRDTADQVELSYKGRRYTYDKWYTKPEHLAAVILNVLNAQEQRVEASE